MNRGITAFDYIFKIVIIGNSSVGKTSLASRLATLGFPIDNVSTIGVEFYTTTVTDSKKTYKLQMWDTGGQEKFKSVVSAYYRGSHGCFLVYDIMKRDSFESLEGWYNEFRALAGDQAVVVVLGNKLDEDEMPEEKKKVKKKEAEDWAKNKGCLFYEVSAKTGKNCDDCLKALINGDKEHKGLVTKAEAGELLGVVKGDKMRIDTKKNPNEQKGRCYGGGQQQPKSEEEATDEGNDTEDPSQKGFFSWMHLFAACIPIQTPETMEKLQAAWDAEDAAKEQQSSSSSDSE